MKVRLSRIVPQTILNHFVWEPLIPVTSDLGVACRRSAMASETNLSERHQVHKHSNGSIDAVTTARHSHRTISYKLWRAIGAILGTPY